MGLKVNIIARTNGVGLDRDVDLLHGALSSHGGFEVHVSHCRSVSPLRRWIPAKERYDVNLYLERVFPRWFGGARLHVLIPNQERFPERHLKRLRKIDRVFCKSRHAEEIFSKHGDATYTGFTSKDMLDETVVPDYGRFLHLAGRSTLKGTETVLDLWGRHPEWPVLTLLQCKENAPDRVPANVNLISDYLPDSEIIRHLNSHGIHLCTSLSEGWGHYLAEAMSCRAVVVATDAPPMNELVAPGRGIPVPAHRQEPRHLGVNYYIDPGKLESTIEQLLSDDLEKKRELGSAAREWFLENDRSFREILPRAVADLAKNADVSC